MAEPGCQSGDESAGETASELEQVALKHALVKLRDRAYGYLVRREHSAHELRQKLGRFDEFELRFELVDKLIADNAQSDLRFAEHLGRVRTGAGKGPILLRQEFQKHHIDDIIVEEVMAGYEGQWQQLAERVRTRKFGEDLPTDYKEWARQARFLQQRGFSAEHIRRPGD